MDEKPIKLMVVDDEEGIVDLVMKIFKRRGFETFGALNGPDAVELFKKERPQISLIDVFLAYSSLDGVEVLEKIKQIDKNAICIMVTRVTDKDKVEKARSLGALHYITKPLDAELLKKVVDEAKELVNKRGCSCG